jgi:anthranilate synthase/aminodeoxychorismate synthase-like glutamine amidotransferase
MLLVIDNYDSFVYNLVQYFGELYHGEIRVYRNDKITIEEIEKLRPKYIVISPGPCTPNEAGISIEVIRRFAGRIPILGVCLGHQAIGQAFGGKIIRARRIMHGKTSTIYHDGKTIFKDIPNPFVATRYHSLVVDKKTLPKCLEITATAKEDNEIMGLRVKFLPDNKPCKKPVEGVQFHPESILTNVGKQILKNFLSL